MEAIQRHLPWLLNDHIAAIKVLTITFLLIVASWKVWIRKHRCWKQNGPYPWVGNIFQASWQPHILMQQIHDYSREAGHVFLAWIGPRPMLFFSSAEYIEPILNSRHILVKGPNYRFLTEWLGSGLLLSDGKKWLKRRRLITPTFHFVILQEFVGIFEEQALILVEKLKQFADTSVPTDIQVPVSLAKLDSICQTSMGVKVDAQHSPSSEYVQAINSMTALIQLRQRSPWLWSRWLYRFTPSGRLYYKNLGILHRFTRDVIHKSIESRKEGHREERRGSGEDRREMKRKKVFLDMLLDLYDSGEIDIAGIQEEVDTFMFEGHDTTAASLSWTLYELGRKKNRPIQEKLYQEISDIDPNLSIVEAVKSCRYLDAVIKEGMRLHPPVPIFSRTAKEDVVVENKNIPRGTEIGIFVYALHRNPEYWDDPDDFIPERFLDEKHARRHPYSYIPFSAGSRNCVGQKFAMLEEKIMLYHLISNFRFTSVQEETDVRGCMEIIHKSENGLLLSFTSRTRVNPENN